MHRPTATPGLIATAILLLTACSGGGSYTPPPADTGDSLSGNFARLDFSSGNLTANLASVPALTSTSLTVSRFPAVSTNLSTTDALTTAGFSATTSVTAVETFYIGTYELSQSQWTNLVLASGASASVAPWSNVAPGSLADPNGAKAAYGLSKDEIDTVIQAWNAAHGHTVILALPTDNEWEVMARAGANNKRYAWGDDDYPSDLANLALVAENRGISRSPRNVDAGTATIFGVKNSAGNVWEWTSDGNLRGGSWAESVHATACGNRLAIPSDTPYATAGVRLIVKAAP